MDTTEERVCRPQHNIVLTIQQASKYTGIEDYWLEELLLIGDIPSLAIEDLEQYMEDCDTEEDSQNDRKNNTSKRHVPRQG